MRRFIFYLIPATIISFSILINACKEETEEPESLVGFTSITKTIDTDNLSTVSFEIGIEPGSISTSVIIVKVSSVGGEAGTAFITTPDITDGRIELPVVEGDTIVSFTVTPVQEGISFEDIRVDFEILDTGPGLRTEGLDGIFASLYIENNKSLSRELPFIENFDTCDEPDGSGDLPGGWEELVILQNSLETGDWRCSPGFDGYEVNAFSSEGNEGDGCEVWLVSPAIDLSGASEPFLSFDVDRRFETTDFQEYDVKISVDYDGTNYEAATWEVLEPAVAAIEANDPEEDDYENTGQIDISAYIGETINIAFIYYAEGSRLTATILRVDSVVVDDL